MDPTNRLLLAAAVVTFLLGLLHSTLGEALLLRHIPRVQGLPAILGNDDFPKRTLRWTWHVTTLLGWACALILGRFAYLPGLDALERFVVQTISACLFLCAAVAFLGSRGKHAGWFGFFAAAVLSWLAVG
jgi:hypothetical protein